jgi:hypothetical protein
MLVVVAGRAYSVVSNNNSNLSLPDTDSWAAVNLLTKDFHAAAGESEETPPTLRSQLPGGVARAVRRCSVRTPRVLPTQTL